MDIFEQVNEEVRQQRTLAWVKRYGWPIGLVAAALVTLVIGWKGLEAWQITQSEQATDALLERITAQATLEEVAPGLGTVAQLYQASRDPAQAAAIYQSLAQDAPPVWRELATIFYLYTDFANLDGEAIRTRLEPFDNLTHPWRGLAWDLLAASALRDQQYETARTYLTNIISDEASPTNLRERAENVLRVLGA